mmetsp:Transcript_3769/g.5630  ORF Transcript_3769/g.5630 Transcript_3769/m.5630 type:complete len:104 (-) Transcript_3769:53-364(-)
MRGITPLLATSAIEAHIINSCWSLHTIGNYLIEPQIIFRRTRQRKCRGFLSNEKLQQHQGQAGHHSYRHRVCILIIGGLHSLNTSLSHSITFNSLGWDDKGDG